jgi:hypothetical protein
MSVSIKKLWNEYGIGGLFITIIIIFGLYLLFKNLWSKGRFGNENMDSDRNNAYNNGPHTKGAPQFMNEEYGTLGAPVQNPLSGPGLPPSCNTSSVQDTSDLLPKDNNNSWAQLNPVGKGDLANINLLKAGYHIGIDSIGQSLRNANLQIRSEPPNPQINVGPWNLSTIESDFMRPPLEIGQGSQ